MSHYSQAEQQAKSLIAEAEKKMSTRGFFQWLFGSKSRTEDAIDNYQKAGNLFKLAKNWMGAGSAFRIAADLNVLERNKSDAAQCFVLASKCFQKYDLNSAINCLLSAIQIYTDLGRFSMAAKLHSSIAEVFEQNEDVEKAVQHFEQAADYFKVEDNNWSTKKCLLKVAYYSALEFEDYRKAIGIYEEVTFKDLQNTLLQYGAKENLLKALLCHLCVDVLNAKHAIIFYLEKCPAFGASREYKLAKSIIENVEEGEIESFTMNVHDYDAVSVLDPWHTKILLRIKNQIREYPNLM